MRLVSGRVDQPEADPPVPGGWQHEMRKLLDVALHHLLRRPAALPRRCRIGAELVREAGDRCVPSFARQSPRDTEVVRSAPRCRSGDATRRVWGGVVDQNRALGDADVARSVNSLDIESMGPVAVPSDVDRERDSIRTRAWSKPMVVARREEIVAMQAVKECVNASNARVVFSGNVDCGYSIYPASARDGPTDDPDVRVPRVLYAERDVPHLQVAVGASALAVAGARSAHDHEVQRCGSEAAYVEGAPDRQVAAGGSAPIQRP